MFGAKPPPWASGKKPLKEHCLYPLSLVRMPRMDVVTAVIVGDSTLMSPGVRYAVTCRLRAEKVFTLWQYCLPGGIAQDLLAA